VRPQPDADPRKSLEFAPLESIARALSRRYASTRNDTPSFGESRAASMPAIRSRNAAALRRAKPAAD
jgi:hypothetical protein